MHLVMFDIDGTLTQSYDFDAFCFSEAVKSVIGIEVDTDWSGYRHVTDSGILDEIITNLGLQRQATTIHEQVKLAFTERIHSNLSLQPVQAVKGAVVFFEKLSRFTNVEIAIATGGWKETALLKLESAGFDVSNIALASGTDSPIRTEIMQMAVSRCKNQNFDNVSFFGDGPWDKKACEQLAYDFILVGERLDHVRRVKDYSNHTLLLSYLGLCENCLE